MLGRYVGRVLVDMIFELIGCRSTLLVDMSVDTRPTLRPICCDRQSLVYRSTVGDVSVDYRWYQSIVNWCFAEIAAVTLPTGCTKEQSIAYACVLIERGCSSNCRHFEYICNAPYTWLTFVWLVFIRVFNGKPWKPFDIPFPLLLTPLPIHGTNLGSWRPKYNFKAL